MAYIIVKDSHTVVGTPFASFAAALGYASVAFGDDVRDWMNINLRIEENRPVCDGMHIASTGSPLSSFAS